MLIVSLTEYCLLNRYITLPLYNSHTRSPPLIVTFYPTNLAQKKSERFRKNLIRQNLGLKKERTQSELQRSKFVLSFLRFQQNSDVFNFFWLHTALRADLMRPGAQPGNVPIGNSPSTDYHTMHKPLCQSSY